MSSRLTARRNRMTRPNVPIKLIESGFEELKYQECFNTTMTRPYQELLSRARTILEKESKKANVNRLELPEPAVLWVGNKTIFRNYAEFPKLLRRDPDRLLMYLAKELATAASLDGDRAIFIGRKDKTSFSQLFQRYMQDNVTCPVCGSPDTHIVTESRLHFRVCEACGARSSARV